MSEAIDREADVHERPPAVCALAAAVRQEPRAVEQPEADVLNLGLLTIEQAAEALNVPRTWLRDKVTERKVPHTRIGRHVRFTPAHLHQIVTAGEQSAVPAGPASDSRRGRRRLPA